MTKIRRITLSALCNNNISLQWYVFGFVFACSFRNVVLLNRYSIVFGMCILVTAENYIEKWKKKKQKKQHHQNSWKSNMEIVETESNIDTP